MAEQSAMADIFSIPWNKLPHHLTEKILSRLPLKFHFRLRSVSKGWNSLLTSKPFAFESQNPWLMLCTPNMQRPFLVYSFYLQSWETLSLSFLEEKCGIIFNGYPSMLPANSSFASASGLLLLDIPHYFSYRRIYVCNPLSRSFRELPHIPLAVTRILARGIAGGDDSEGYKVIMLGKSRQNSVQLQLYDSAVGSWTPIRAALPDTLAVGNEEMVFCAGKFFCLTSGMSKLLVFDVHGAGNCTLSPMPNGSYKFSRLLTCGGYLLVAGGIEEDGMLKDVIMWQYCCPTWQEVARMGTSLCEGFERRRTRCLKWAWSLLECVGVGENVCFRPNGSSEVLVYSIARGSWMWLPTFPEICKYSFWRSLPFQPKPHMGV